MFQFSLVRMMIVTAAIAFLVAALREETPSSATRLMIGCFCAFVLPYMIHFNMQVFGFKTKRSTPLTRFSQGINRLSNDRHRASPWLGVVLGSTLGLGGLFCVSIFSEALRYTNGLTPWIVPLSFVVGCAWFFSAILPSKNSTAETSNGQS